MGNRSSRILLKPQNWRRGGGNAGKSKVGYPHLGEYGVQRDSEREVCPEQKFPGNPKKSFIKSGLGVILFWRDKNYRIYLAFEFHN